MERGFDLTLFNISQKKKSINENLHGNTSRYFLGGRGGGGGCVVGKYLMMSANF